MKKRLLIARLVLFSFVFLITPCFASTYNIEEFSDAYSWDSLHTKQIQQAIDTCADNGGGTVVVPSGIWFTGTIFLKNNVTVQLEEGALIVSALKRSLFPDIETKATAGSNRISNHAIFYAEGKKNIAITGNGTIRSLGLFNSLLFEKRGRPHILKFVNCEDVTVQGISLEGASTWTQLYLLCSNVTIAGITVYSVFGSTADGLDIDSSTNVTVKNCDIDSFDDAIAIKSTTPHPSSNISVTNCVFRSAQRGIKIGTESIGGFFQLHFKNCTIEKGAKTIYNPFPSKMRAGIFLTTVDGGNASNIIFNNMRITGAQTPCCIVASRRTSQIQTGIIKNLQLENIFSDETSPMPTIISSSPCGRIRGLTIKNYLSRQKKQTILHAPANKLPHNFPGKPSYKMYGKDFSPCKIYFSGVPFQTTHYMNSSASGHAPESKQKQEQAR